jgi:hypothetical protein
MLAVLAAAQPPVVVDSPRTTAKADPNLTASPMKCAADTISPGVLMADRVTFIWPMA